MRKPKYRRVKPRPPMVCDRKRSYNTFEAAVAMAIHRVMAYQCPIKGCGKWHLTSSKGGLEKRYPVFVAVEGPA